MNVNFALSVICRELYWAMLDACARVTRWIDDNDESDAVTIALTIALFSRSVLTISFMVVP